MLLIHLIRASSLEPKHELLPPGYSFIRKDRPDGYGGVLLAIKSDIIHKEVPTTTATECAFAKLESSTPVITASFYRGGTQLRIFQTWA